MVLEDFFTLTEMKDGLATLARVEELVAVMQTSDCIMKNTVDTAREWSTVATILAATGNKHCLSHFIHSDGLRFLNQWLQVAQKCNSDPSDSFVEESISALLGALEKLPIEKEQLSASEIRETIKHLHSHKNFKIQEKARSLFDSWNQVEDEDSIFQDVNKGGAHCDGGGCDDDDPKSSDDMKILMEDGCSKSPVRDVSPIKETVEETVFEHSKATRSYDASQLEIIEDVQIHTSNQDTSLTYSNQSNAEGYQGDVNSSSCSLMSDTCHESLAITKQSSLCPVEVTTSIGTCSSLIPGDKNLDDKSSDVSELKDRNLDDMSSEDNKAMEVNAHNSMIELGESSDIDVKESKSPVRKTAAVGLVDDHSVMGPQTKNRTVDCGMPKHSRSEIEPKHVVQDGKSHVMFLQNLTNTVCISRKPEGPKASFHKKEAFRTVSNFEEHVSELDLKVSKGEDSVIACLKPRKEEADWKSSEIELEYGLDDALEVARQVAKEVEREVVDYREPFCSSSSEKNLDGEIMQPSSPDSVEGEHDEYMMEKSNEDKMSMEEDLCADGSSPKAKRLRISNETDSEPECRANDLESPNSAAATQETEDNNDKSMCSFDLNEDVYTDEMECSATLNQPIYVSASIPIVASLKGTPVFPTTPLHFEGELGWRGSAATSAFHPPSTRRTPDREKTSLIDGSHYCSKQSQNLFEIDLNVAEGGDDAILDLASSSKHVHVSYGLHSRDSSVEVSLRRADKLKLDLNCVGENEDTCAFPSLDWKAKGQLYNYQNGKHGPSPASSSLSRQTLMRDFDLNDNPAFFDAGGSHDHRFNSDKALYQMKDYGSSKLDDPVVSIMGSKIGVGRKEFVNQTYSFLSNRQGIEPNNSASLVRACDGSGAQPALTFAPVPHPTFGYNGLMMGPTMSLHPQLYGAPGSVPYMVDARGSTVRPQIVGSSSSVVSPSFSRPFFMSVDGPSGSNGAGFSQSGLDLNSGVPSVAADGREMGTFRQLFVHGPGN